MPTYEFYNEQTDHYFERFMSISNKEQYLKDNPDVRQVHTKFPGMVSGVGFDKKQDSGWKENLHRIAEAHPDSPLAEKVKGKSSKEAKISEIKKKHGFGNKDKSTL